MIILRPIKKDEFPNGNKIYINERLIDPHSIEGLLIRCQRVDMAIYYLERAIKEPDNREEFIRIIPLITGVFQIGK